MSLSAGLLAQGLPFRKYTLPDKAVASQVLMYRQLLHTECKPGLRLSRAFQGTEAQKAVMHMPWWEQGVEKSKRMVISYDNLIVRLWLNGCVMPYVDGGYAEEHSNTTAPKDEDASLPEETKTLGSMEEILSTSKRSLVNDGADIKNNSHIDTLIDEKGLPPIPHKFWVDRLGFQQTDPVTDFRSGGVLSLAMLVHIVEACPNVHARFLPSGDAHMLPFGITCINVTDMIAKFCMFSKSVDRMDALLSQKPFWRMFGDPNSLLVLQEVCMDMLCDVVVEIGRERKLPKIDEKDDGDNGRRFLGQDEVKEVTVFDFAEILSRTEKRVTDLLSCGPKSVDDLRLIHQRLCTKYLKALVKRERQAERKQKGSMLSPEQMKVMTGSVVETAEGVFSKFKQLSFRPTPTKDDNISRANNEVTTTEEIDFAMPPNHEESPASNNEDTTKSSSVEIQQQTPDLINLNEPDVTSDVDTNDYNISENDDENNLKTLEAYAFTIDDDEDDFL